MGNCQATDAAAVVIHHPGGSLERLYWPTTAGEVMRSHPGHYVALVTFHISGDDRNTTNSSAAAAAGGTLRLTRVQILKHKEQLLIGQVYRFVTSQEVAKALQARKQERVMKSQAAMIKQQKTTGVEERAQAAGNERERQRNSRQWRPSLQSISEAGS